MKSLISRYKLHFGDKKFILSLTLSLLLLASSLVANFYAGIYATEKASSSVTDIILNNIPTFDVDGMFMYGPLILWGFVSILCLIHPKRIPFVLKSISLFILIRSIFVTLTHIGPFPDQLAINYSSDLVKKFTFGGDLFFSAHTGLPFLMALVFWKNKYLRVIFIGTSIFFGIIVLMVKLHYSIDVLSAFFITYTIYHIAEIIFKGDKEIFESQANIQTP